VELVFQDIAVFVRFFSSKYITLINLKAVTMKTLLVLTSFYIFCAISCFSQTEQAELNNIFQRRTQGKYTTAEYPNVIQTWRDIISDLGGYPKLPYDSTKNQIIYHFKSEFPNTPKRDIFNRIMEWGAINFGSLDQVLHYSNFETGKIILKGWFSVIVEQDYATFWSGKKEILNERKCYFTMVFTIQDNKMKMDIPVMNFEYVFGGYVPGGTYIPLSSKSILLSDLIPVTNTHWMDWRGNINMLIFSDLKIKLLQYNLTEFINITKQDYSF
jgi:hypothetical protein